MFNQQIKTTYNQIAARYAEINAAMPESLVAAAGQFLQMLPPGARILEAGCGHGRDAAWFEAQGCSATGADLSHGMLAQARHIVQGPLIQLDMRVLPFRDATFDGIWCNAALLHLPKHEAPHALEEFYRILKPTSALFISLQGGESEVWESQSYGHTAPRFFARYAPEEAAAMLTACGFTLHTQSSEYQNPRRYWLHLFALKDIA